MITARSLPLRDVGMALRFEWHGRKARMNVAKHGVSFDEARTVFGDPLSITVADLGHTEDEYRFVIVGLTDQRRLVVVSHVERGDTIRIVSARTANRREKKAYEEDQDERT